MATTKSLKSLEKSKDAVVAIKEKLLPVLQRLADDKFGEATGRAQASVALSIGMMRYMGARLRGLDQGKKADDLLRKDLNNIKRVLAKTKKTQTTDATGKSTKPPTKDSMINQSPKQKIESKAQTKGNSLTVEKTSHKKKRKTKSGVNNETKQMGSPSKKSRKNWSRYHPQDDIHSATESVFDTWYS